MSVPMSGGSGTYRRSGRRGAGPCRGTAAALRRAALRCAVPLLATLSAALLPVPVVSQSGDASRLGSGDVDQLAGTLMLALTKDVTEDSKVALLPLERRGRPARGGAPAVLRRTGRRAQSQGSGNQDQDGVRPAPAPESTAIGCRPSTRMRTRS